MTGIFRAFTHVHYLIDGYNLMFRIERADEELQLQRNRLIHSLDNKFEILNLKGFVIFDAHFQEGEGSFEYAKNLEIFYTAHSQTADETILELLKGLKPISWTVVTSDKPLALQARRAGFKTEGIEQFLAWLKKRIQNKGKKREKYAPRQLLSPLKKKIPSLQALPEECQNYYLEAFQREIEPEKPKIKTKKRRSKALPEIKQNELHLSDFERWLKAFEESEG